jgi:hypothetical protein
MAARKYTGEVTTIMDAHASGKGLWALCRNCGRVKFLRPWDLLKKTPDPDKTTLIDLGRRLMCNACHHRVTVLIPSDGIGHGYAGLGGR